MKKNILFYLLSLWFLPLAFGQTDGENSDFVEEEYINYKTAEAPLDRLASYKERRMSTGAYLSIAYSQFRPFDYNPSFAAQDFDTLYGGDSSQMIELSFIYKINFALGSIGLGFGVGYQKLESDLTYADSYLSVAPTRIETIFSFDNLFDNPYIVPYGVAGLYTVYYREEQASSAFTGTTEAAPYFGGGVSFRIDGFMPEESFNAYRENFQENSFVYLEVRKWIESANIQDPNFATDFQFGGGVRFEF
ncbi:MAG: hypothetical protein A4S09_08855 [Proteobacteria bacterium SG_bin7]|nr:MAG: hypothetical protein A4S09_08855 [Proteobacteria bacterium SG_bin7]